MLENVKELFRESMSRLASGVSIVTTKIDGRPWGLTVSACSSISMDPPLLMVSLASGNASMQAILGEQCFGVSILNKNQMEIAKAGAKSGEPKFFEKYVVQNGLGENYQVENALAHIDCDVYKTVEAGDHTIFIGSVKQVILGDINMPLLYFHRQFGSFDKEFEKEKAL